MKSKKRILSIIFVFVMAFAMAATACGKKEETAEKEETKQEETSDTDEAGVDDKNDAEAADNEDESSDKVMKTGEDTLTEEDIQSLKDSIRDTVISEYLEPNNISVEDFAWPNEDGDWGYLRQLYREYDLALALGYDKDEFDISEVDSSPSSNPEVIKAVFNGIINWIKNQGDFDLGYMKNVFSAVYPCKEVIPTIDLAAK